jgi:hypothetical protein
MQSACVAGALHFTSKDEKHRFSSFGVLDKYPSLENLSNSPSLSNTTTRSHRGITIKDFTQTA